MDQLLELVVAAERLKNFSYCKSFIKKIINKVLTHHVGNWNALATSHGRACYRNLFKITRLTKKIKNIIKIIKIIKYFHRLFKFFKALNIF
jgi:hypothetical protein